MAVELQVPIFWGETEVGDAVLLTQHARRDQAGLVCCLAQKPLLLQAGTARLLWKCPNSRGCRPALAAQLCLLVHRLRQELGCEQAVSEKAQGQKATPWWASPREAVRH